MKKIIFAIALFVSLSASSSFADGQYTGIWAFYHGGTFVGYVSAHQNGDQIIAVGLDSDMTWGASSGTVTGNTATVQSLISTVSRRMDVEFTSPTTLVAVQVSCYPLYVGYYCSLPDGAVLIGQKVF